MKTSLALNSLFVFTLLVPTACAGGAAPSTSVSPPGQTPVTKGAAPSPTPKAADAPRYGGILNTTLNADMPSFDVQQETGLLTQAMVQSNYSGLVQSKPSQIDAVIGDLAERWDVSPDGTSYAFRLRKGVRFHDASPLTTEDVKYSLERIYDPPRGVLSPRKGTLASIKGVEATDQDSIKISLKYVQSSFLPMLAVGQIVVYPKKIVEAKGNMKKDIVGTGPFMFKDYSPGTIFEVKKNPNYFIKDRPYLDGIRFYLIKDPSTMLAAFRTGQVRLMDPSWSGGLLPGQVQTIRKEMPQAVVSKYPAFSTRWLNMVVTLPPFTDVRVRKAVSLAVDRQAAVKILESGEADVGGPLVAGSDWAIPEAELLKMPGYRQPKDADLAEARRLLAEAGFPSGLRTRILARAKYTDDLAVLAKEQLARIGIDLEIDVQESATFLEQIDKLRNPMVAQPVGLRMSDPDELIRYFVTKGGSSWTGLSDPEVDALFERQSRALDVAERKKIVRELELKLLDITPSVVLLWRRGNIGHWPEVKNYFRGNAFNNNKFQDVWLAK
ncbi:MAG: ABC transporter substrate-binding protein [Chloroflexi bacterium]|nr:ABC transporter substrate-binding protein [Chloroflexota bacterium]